MPMSEWLLKCTKKAGGDIASTIIQALFWTIVGGPILFVSISKEAANFALQLALVQTPLWAATALTALCCLYTYVKVEKNQVKLAQKDQALPIPSNKTDISARLDPVKERILVFVAKEISAYDEQIAKHIEVLRSMATLHLHELRDEGFLKSTPDTDCNDYDVDSWSVEPQGLKYLRRHGLL